MLINTLLIAGILAPFLVALFAYLRAVDLRREAERHAKNERDREEFRRWFHEEYWPRTHPKPEESQVLIGIDDEGEMIFSQEGSGTDGD